MAKIQSSCLALHYNEKYVKYAKIIKNSNNALEIKDHGIKFVKDTVKETIYNIILDTDSKAIPIILNSNDTKYYEFKVFKQITNSDSNNAIKLEFEDWCEKNSVSAEEYNTVSLLSEVAKGDYRKGILAINSKKDILDFSKISDVNISAIYPLDLSLTSIVNNEEKNYILFNLDDLISTTLVINSKIVEVKQYDIGMLNVLSKFEDVLGSYQKAYDSCKQINVFTEDESSHNKVQIEEMLEPILQEILTKITPVVNENKRDISKIILTGSGTLFTNIDTLITEYFGIKCEILKPLIINSKNNIKNISEIIEVNSAIALGYEYNISNIKNIDFVKTSKKSKVDLKDIFKNKNKKEKTSFKFEMDNSLQFVTKKILPYPLIVMSLGLISYIAYSNIYMNKANEIINKYNGKTSEYVQTLDSIEDDITLVTINKNLYKQINDNINDKLQKIEANEIGKLTTYNVASFMQKLVKIVPSNLKIDEISSDDNKNIKIVATANNYPTVGYFVANLRLNSDLITNVVIKEIVNGGVVTVEIGGELP